MDKKNLICGFGFFVGDYVKINEDKIGYVQWISLAHNLISVRFKQGGKHSYSVVPPNKVEKIASGRRGVSTLFSLTELKSIYEKMSIDKKCFFHYNDNKNREEIAKELSISIEQVKNALEKNNE